MIQKYFISLAAIIAFPLLLSAQKITYSQPDRDDVRSADFDVVGKLNGHYLVYKHVRSSYSISIFDNDMELLDKVKMDFLPDKLINSDIITYRDYFYFIYQYQKRNIVYCEAARINGDGKITGDPVTLDTTSINFFASNKIYNVLYSDDKQRIGVYKINSKDDNNYIFTSSIFDGSLKLISKYTNSIPMQAHNDFLTEFSLDNDGWMTFVKASGNNSNNGTIQNVSLLVKRPDVDSISNYALNISKIYLDDIRIKVDNINKHLLVTGFLFNAKKEATLMDYIALYGTVIRVN